MRARLLRAVVVIVGLAAGGCGPGGEENPAPGPWRLADHLAELRIDAGETQKIEDRLVLEFDRAGDLDRVVRSRGIEPPIVSGGALRFVTDRERSNLDVRIDLEAGDVTVVVLRMRRSDETSLPRLGWNQADPALSVKGRALRFHRFDPGGGPPAYYTFVEDHASWTGRIASLRIWPASAAGVEVEIESLSLLHTSAASRWFLFEGGRSLAGSASIAGQTREVLLAVPPSTIEGALRVPPSGARARFGFGLLQPSWRGAGPDVRFRVSLATGTGRTVLFERWVNPWRAPGDRRWFDARVDLSPWAGRTVRLRFETDAAEPGDAASRYAVWSDPVVYRPEGRAGGVGGGVGGATNVLLVSLDTVRADRLGVYGHPVPTSPELDRFAREALVFETAVSQAPYTLASHMSLFLSLHPTAHGVTDRDSSLPPGSTTMARILRDAGFATAAFTEGGYVGALFGFNQGFERYDEAVEGQGERGGFAERTFGRAIEWLRGHRDRPFFLFVHTYEAHVPYCPGPPYDSLFDPDYAGPLDPCLDPGDLRAVNHEAIGLDPSDPAGFGTRPPTPADVARIESLYEGEIRKTDRQFGRLLVALRDLGLADRTLVVVLADHGEDLGDHLVLGDHTFSLYEELLRVPLLVRMPGLPSSLHSGRGRAPVADPVSLVDVLPTLLDLLGVEGPGGLSGRSFADRVRGAAGAAGLAGPAGPASGPIFSETSSLARRAMVREGSFKLIRTLRIDESRARATHDPWVRRLRGLVLGDELYDLRLDPRERHDLAAKDPGVVRRLGRVLERHLASEQARAASPGRTSPARVPLEGAARRRLEALGYLDSEGERGPR